MMAATNSTRFLQLNNSAGDLSASSKEAPPSGNSSFFPSGNATAPAWPFLRDDGGASVDALAKMIAVQNGTVVNDSVARNFDPVLVEESAAWMRAPNSVAEWENASGVPPPPPLLNGAPAQQASLSSYSYSQAPLPSTLQPPLPPLVSLQSLSPSQTQLQFNPPLSLSAPPSLGVSGKSTPIASVPGAFPSPSPDYCLRVGTPNPMASPRFAYGALRADLAYFSSVHRDHCAILALMISSALSATATLFDRAVELNRAWDQHMRRYGFYADTNDSDSAPQSSSLSPSPSPIVGYVFARKPMSPRTMEVLPPIPLSLEDARAANDTGYLIEQTVALERAVQNQNEASWTGWVFPSFLHEILAEEEYARSKVLAGEAIMPNDDVTYWNEHARDHSLVTRQWLDPADRKDWAGADVAAATADTLAQPPESCPDIADGGAECFSVFVALSLVVQRQQESDASDLWKRVLTKRNLAVASGSEAERIAREQGLSLADLNDTKFSAPPLLLSHTMLEAQYGAAVLLGLGIPLEDIMESMGIAQSTTNPLTAPVVVALLGEARLRALAAAGVRSLSSS